MYVIRQTETKAIIDHFIGEADAHFAVLMYEHDDKLDGIYEPYKYEVWNEEKFIYDVKKDKYYELEMVIPPFVDNANTIFIFKDIDDSEHRLMLEKNAIENHFYGGVSFIRYWEANHE